MSDLIAIGYPDEGTAAEALAEAERLQGDLLIQADAMAAIRRDAKGSSTRPPTSTRSAWAPRGACSGAFSSA